MALNNYMAEQVWNAFVKDMDPPPRALGGDVLNPGIYKAEAMKYLESGEWAAWDRLKKNMKRIFFKDDRKKKLRSFSRGTRISPRDYGLTRGALLTKVGSSYIMKTQSIPGGIPERTREGIPTSSADLGGGI